MIRRDVDWPRRSPWPDGRGVLDTHSPATPALQRATTLTCDSSPAGARYSLGERETAGAPKPRPAWAADPWFPARRIRLQTRAGRTLSRRAQLRDARQVV